VAHLHGDSIFPTNVMRSEKVWETNDVVDCG